MEREARCLNAIAIAGQGCNDREVTSALKFNPECQDWVQISKGAEGAEKDTLGRHRSAF